MCRNDPPGYTLHSTAICSPESTVWAESNVHDRFAITTHFTLSTFSAFFTLSTFSAFLTPPQLFWFPQMAESIFTLRHPDLSLLAIPRALSVLVVIIAASMLVSESALYAQAEVTEPIAASNSTDTEAPIESAVPTSLQGIIKAIGYPFAFVFILASIVGLWSAIERFVLLRKRRVIPHAFVDRFLMHLRTGRMDKPNAISVCQQNASPVADIFLHGVRKWGKPSVEIEQAVMDGGERQVALLKKRLRILNGVATIMPLVGLLGTVTGMIEAFNNIANSNAIGQAAILASGIAMALLTTAIGLFIAIPALTAYMFLAGRIDSLVVEMDRLGQEVVHLISAESLRERGEPSSAR